jgi:hypothetical protein
MRFCFTLLASVILPCLAATAAESIPILAWGGPPADQTSVERYKELAEAGFTHNYSGFGNAQAMLSALDIAQAAGVKAFVSVPELKADPEGTARKFKDHPAVAGYYLRDEPSSGDFAMLADWERRVRSADSEHPCYINLFPNYADAGQLGAPNYREYLNRFVSTVPVKMLSFDHYPVVGKSLRAEWYENLEQVAEVARAASKPFWAFVLSVAHGPYPVPSVEQLRVQAFSDLAYGAQGIQYFTYWTSISTVWDFHEGPIDPAGHRTAVYDRVKQVNAEIHGLSPVFLGARVTGVRHTGALPRGTRAYEVEAPVRTLKTEGGAVVSMIEKGTRRHLVVVNRDFNASMPLEVTFDPAAKIVEVTKGGGTHLVEAGSFARTVAPGDIVVFAWEAAKVGGGG